jgi:phosphoribosylformylglycinamidine (FGAM) synthase PurS component
MKKILCMILMISFSNVVYAQQPAQAKRVRTKATVQDIQVVADRIRSKEQEIREFFLQMILRKAQLDVQTVLVRKNLPKEEIEQVMQSREMKLFVSRLEKHPKIHAKVDAHVRKFLKPGVIEDEILKRREMLEKSRQETQVLARLERRKSSKFRSEEKVFDPEDDKTLIGKVWDHLVNDLYKD